MKAVFFRLCVAATLFTSGACKTKALQELDGSGGGIGGIDAAGDGGAGVGDGGGVGVGDGGSAIDRPPLDVPFAGRRSFNVTAEVFTDASGTIVTSHAFTMTIDAPGRTSIIGVFGGGETRSVEETPAGLRLRDPVGFGVPVAAPCGGSVRYDDLVFTVDASGALSGSGRGELTLYDGNAVPLGVAATMRLRGVPDAEPPTLSLSAGGQAVDPWSPIWVAASEPLPEWQVLPVLRSASGDVITLDAQHTADSFVASFVKPSRLLRFGEQYSLTFEGITDLAGNAPRPEAPLTFTTRPAPPLIPADGFESVTDATLGGARVLSGAGAPVLTGTRSLYIPPAPSLASPTQLAVRLSLAFEQRLVRFDYRTVNPADGLVTWLVAGVGGTIETATPGPDIGAATTPAMIDGTPVALGPMRSAEIFVRPDAVGEIVFARVAAQAGGRCGGPPPPPVPGAIIDNLRVE